MTDQTEYSPEQAFARDLLIVAVNGGINRWARVHGCLIDVPAAAVRAEGIDTVDRSVWNLTLADVQRAITKLVEQPEDSFGTECPYDSGTRAALSRLVRDMRDGYPAWPERVLPRSEQPDNPKQCSLVRHAADVVIQIAVAGEVIY